MAPRKSTKAGSTGEDLGSLGKGWSCFLDKSLVKEADLDELVSSGSLTEGQGSCGGEAVVPSPGDGRTVVFAAYFAAGVRFPCDNFLPSVLSMTSQGTQTTIVDIQTHVLQKYKRLQMQRERLKRAKPGSLTSAAGDSTPQAILDGSDKTNFNKTAPTRKIFSSGVGGKESKTEYYPLYSASHTGRGGMMQDITKGS
uniref:Retrotransposon protein, putative, Ty3-gypsy subclass n=1 Tax=Oryza sativa subsp. japonica TaxID=39947 RepID=Q2QTM4_ORYSJ|nr:retrotransposon protein, putative, Ty3-gypsy subclass [Oryza sativa Japonica Group]